LGVVILALAFLLLRLFLKVKKPVINP